VPQQKREDKPPPDLHLPTALELETISGRSLSRRNNQPHR